MTDFNKEFELLHEYIKYRIDWTTDKLVYGKRFVIDLYGVTDKFTAEYLFDIYRQQGILFTTGNNQTAPTIETRIMTFEEFKEQITKFA